MTTFGWQRSSTPVVFMTFPVSCRNFFNSFGDTSPNSQSSQAVPGRGFGGARADSLLSRIHGASIIHTGSLLVLLTASLLFIGCGNVVTEQQYRTEIEIPNPGSSYEPFRKTKWYRFEGEMGDVDSVKFKQASLMVIDPDDRDLTFISSIRIFVERDDELVLFAKGSDFAAGEHIGELTIMYTDDLKPFVDETNRVWITWEIMPNRWYRNWPPNGFTVLADVLFELDVNL